MKRLHCFSLLVTFLFFLVTQIARAGAEAAITTLSSLRQLSTETRTPHALDLNATVWYADSKNGLLILRDDTATAEIHLDFENQSFAPGDTVRLSGTASLMNRDYGCELTPVALVDNDGIHIARERSATLHLESGLHPLRADWFNASDAGHFSVEYAGPGFSRKSVPDDDLLQSTEGTAQTRPGLLQRAYRKNLWMLPPNRDAGILLLEGEVKNFDITFANRKEYVGATYTGFLKIRAPGDYTFFLKSDDGSRLFVGPTSLRVEKKSTPGNSPALPAPVVLFAGQLTPATAEYARVTIEGRATRASHAGNENYWRLESGAGQVSVEIGDTTALPITSMLGNIVRMTGVIRRGLSPDGVPLMGTLFVQDASQIKILTAASTASAPTAPPNITPITQVERIDRALLGDGKPPVRTRIQGVVTRVVASVPGIVLQDETRGIYVNLEHLPAAPVQIGELLEIAGTVEPGEFSPFVIATEIVRRGAGIMPKPIRASREEMTNGSLHSQYVEIEGYVLAVDPKTITLRTRSGVLRVETETEPSDAWLNAVVRMRGCLRVFWDTQTRQITSSRVGLDYAEISIERPPPADLYAVSQKNVSQLLMFDPYAESFQRTRLVAQLVQQSGTELALIDADTKQGLRASLIAAAPFAIGDIVELAGFPEFDGPSPHFDHTIARKIGRTPLPPPRTLAPEKLLGDEYDSTRVTIDAELLDTGYQDGRETLQLRTGANTFAARFDLRSNRKTDYTPGSRLRLTGVYRGLGGNRSLDRPVSAFELVLTSADDITILATPSWWTFARLLAVVGVLCVILALALLWITSLRRQVARQTAQLETVLEERHRVEQAEALAKERSRLAYDLHDELGSGLSEIGMMSTLVASPTLAPEKRHGYIMRLTDTARRLISSLDEIVWAVNPRYDAISSFASYYTTYAQQFLELASLRCRLDIADELPAHPLSSRVRHTLFLAFKEALTNVAKHARATEVVIGIAIENHDARKHLVISVADDGCGIAPGALQHARPAHHGLASLADRLRQLDGACLIEPNSPRGTRVTLKVPLT